MKKLLILALVLFALPGYSQKWEKITSLLTTVFVGYPK